MTNITAEKEPQTKVEPQNPPSRRKPAWHVGILSLFSLGLYLPVWFYRVSRQLQRHAQERAAAGESNLPYPLDKYVSAELLDRVLFNPVARGVLTLVPFIQFVAMGLIFRDIATLDPQEGSYARRNPAYAAFALTVAIICLFQLGIKADGPAVLLFTLCSIPAAIAQSWLNRYWQSVEPEEIEVRYAFSPLEIVLIIIGGMFVGLIAISSSIQPGA